MGRLKRSDRNILLEMQEEYGADTIANAIIAIAKNGDSNMEVTVSEPKSADEAVLDYIKQLEGFRIRLREFHWSATHNSLHKLTDDMIEKLEDYEDSIAEDFMGVIDERIKVNQLVPVMPKSTELKDMIKEVTCSTYDLMASIENEIDYRGILNILEDVTDYLWKCKYLETLQ